MPKARAARGIIAVHSSPGPCKMKCVPSYASSLQTVDPVVCGVEVCARCIPDKLQCLRRLPGLIQRKGFRSWTGAAFSPADYGVDEISRPCFAGMGGPRTASWMYAVTEGWQGLKLAQDTQIRN